MGTITEIMPNPGAPQIWYKRKEPYKGEFQWIQWEYDWRLETEDWSNFEFMINGQKQTSYDEFSKQYNRYKVWYDLSHDYRV